MKSVSKYMILMAGCALCLGGIVPDASAVRYTTRDSGSSKEAETPTKDTDTKPQEKKKKVSCNGDYLSAIKSFNPKAVEKRDEFEKLIDGKDSVKTPKQAKQFTKELERLQAFYHSEEFELMEQIYAKCGMDIPRPKAQMPYFFPEDLGVDEEVNAI